MSYRKHTPISIGLLVVLVIVACLIWIDLHHPNVSHSVSAQIQPAPVSTIATTSAMTFEIASTSAKQERGLGGRSVIPDNYAMLFVFPQDGSYGFWMKDMLAPIDMIWLTDNGTIASITPSAQPDTYPAVFYPPQPIRYVLETRAGFAAEKEWHVGTVVPLPSTTDTSVSSLPTSK